jgi:hypothetical protein
MYSAPESASARTMTAHLISSARLPRQPERVPVIYKTQSLQLFFHTSAMLFDSGTTFAGNVGCEQSVTSAPFLRYGFVDQKTQ